mmetsp:Transcript_3073/g.7871  ORF Transcript_3073/g.7871 Transcript_3073/m.7871 type:complete len:295 (-) Transcript_3073:154-1038(-)
MGARMSKKMNLNLDGCMLPGFLDAQDSPYRAQGKLQESDLLERRPQGENDGDHETNAVRLVSLGCYCGVKSSFQNIGRGSEHLPFDWMRTSLEGLERFIKTDFAGFFDWIPPAKPIKAPPGKNMNMVLYRHYQHSFWHDDPTDSSMQEKYTRRIERLRNLDGHSSTVLFVRAAVQPNELLASSRFLKLLEEKFGPNVKLMHILLKQGRLKGPAQIKNLPNLLVWYHDSEGQPAQAAFTDAVKEGLNWAVDRQMHVLSLNSPEEAVSWADHYCCIYAYDHYVFEGLGVDGRPPAL